MAALNKVLLIGNLGRDPEVRTLPSGNKVATISIATTESYTNKNGERVDETEWHRVEFWSKLADIVEKYLKKGDSVYVEGKIRTEKYTDANNIERYTTKIRALNMQMLGGKSDNKSNEKLTTDEMVAEDDLPF